MPTINIKKELLMEQLGHHTDEQFDELCFRFGLELDEITSEKNMALKEQSATGKESDDIIYKIDIPANRYDLLSLEGLVLALKIFTNKIAPPEYSVLNSGVEFSVDSHADAVRPILLGALVQNVNMDQNLYNSFIDLQDKLHQTIGRRRSIVSIGAHDFDTIEGPFLYTATEPNKLEFVPLNQDRKYTAAEMMSFYADSHLKPYLSIIKDKPKYPVIMDKTKTVLSMPPIINGNKSKITLNTRNILIEVTATDRAKATIALDTLVIMLLSANPAHQARCVRIKHVDGRSYTTPCLKYRTESISQEYICKSLGLSLKNDEMISLLTRMGLRARVSSSSQGVLEIDIPPTRHDIIHKCDIVEDVAIAYGYDNFKRTLPEITTIATQIPLNKLTDQLRYEVSRCGYTEVLNFALCSEEEIGTMLRKSKIDGAVRVQNPKTSEFQVARTCLLTGLLKTLNSNKKMPLPMKLFEVGDVVLLDPKNEVGAKNERHLAAIYHGKQTSGFEIIHGLLDRLMQVLDCPYIGESSDKESLDQGYYIKAVDDASYLPGRCAAVICNRERIGLLGILHPEVLTSFELNHPSSALEISVERFPFVTDSQQ
mgnify:CR=1 FL=1